jgi:hypothetical protein
VDALDELIPVNMLQKKGQQAREGFLMPVGVGVIALPTWLSSSID